MVCQGALVVEARRGCGLGDGDSPPKLYSGLLESQLSEIRMRGQTSCPFEEADELKQGQPERLGDSVCAERLRELFSHQAHGSSEFSLIRLRVFEFRFVVRKFAEQATKDFDKQISDRQ